MPLDMFMAFTKPQNGAVPVEGETDDTTYKSVKAIELLELSFGVENPATVGSSSGGAGVGKAKFKEFTFKTYPSAATASLAQTMVRGGHYSKATIYLRKADAPSKGTVGSTAGNDSYLRIELGLVFITSYDISASSGDELPTETFVAAFGQYRLSYRPEVKGGFGPAKVSQWDQTKNDSDLPQDF